MKREALLIALTLSLVTISGAVVYENGSSPSSNIEEGRMAITSGGSTAGSSTAVGPNGTEWSSSVEMIGRDGNITEESVTEPVFTEKERKNLVRFNGSITSPDLCHVIEHDVEETEEGYSLNIKTVKDELDQPCGQQQTMIDYKASFQAEAPYNLTVLHNGEEMETFQAENEEGTPSDRESEEKGAVESFLDWLGNLF